MLIAIAGPQGSGKTLTMSVLATYLQMNADSILYDNYSLIDSNKIHTQADLWKLDNAILCLDELWLTMDSRLWKDNVFLSRFINQTRKKKLIVFYTTQHMSQIEMRVRNATDYLIFCERKNDEIVLTLVDWQYSFLLRKFVIQEPKLFYPLFDTFQVLQPLLP